MDIPELETTRLRLICLNESHLDTLYDIYSDDETMKYWANYPHKNIDETETMLKRAISNMEDGIGISWGITLKENVNRIIGTISYDRYQKDGLAIIGCILEKEHWNNGIMSEAFKEFIEYGMSVLKIHRIEGHVKPGNVNSEKLLNRIGFQKEGLLRQRSYYKDAYHDLIIYSLLRSDKRNT